MVPKPNVGHCFCLQAHVPMLLLILKPPRGQANSRGGDYTPKRSCMSFSFLALGHSLSHAGMKETSQGSKGPPEVRALSPWPPSAHLPISHILPEAPSLVGDGMRGAASAESHCA